jgi:hypothetical protein
VVSLGKMQVLRDPSTGSRGVSIETWSRGRPQRHFGDTTNSDVTVLYSGTSVTVLKGR